MTLTSAFRELEGKHAVVLGGAGFLGSHLCTRLIYSGARVTCLDNMITGNAGNVAHLMGDNRFRLIDYDVTDYLHVPGKVDYVMNFASPASPVDYLRWPIHTLKVGAFGTHKGLGLALDKGAVFFLASTSEVYGDPLVNPQPETYWGNVNPIGPRGVYDEAKRFAEALTLAYHREHGLQTRIVRIFNSILGDEQVLVDDGTVLRRERVEDFARRMGSVDLEGVTVPGFDRVGRIAARESTAIIGHPTSQRCFEVIIQYGRSIRVTGDHSLFVEGEDGRPVAKPISQIDVGQRIAIARRIEVPERDPLVFDVVERWIASGADAWEIDVRHSSLGDIAWRRRQEIFDLVAVERPPGATEWRSAIWSQIRSMRERSQLPARVIKHLGLVIPGDSTVRLHTSGRSAEMPALTLLTNEMLWLFGVLVAEGHVHSSPHDSFFTIASGVDVLDRAAKIVERDIGLRVVRSPASHERSASIFVHSKLFVWLLDVLGLGSGPKSIPGWILGLPLSRLGWFLEGYREGDGIHSGAKFDEGIRHEFSTTSDALKDDLIVAFARFGLVPSVGRYETTFRQRTGDRRYPFWRLTLSHVRPWSPLEWHRGVTQRLQAPTTGDLVWARVKRVLEIEPTSLVYDFCVPGYENFWAGTGVMAHNTFGPRMRPNDGRAVPSFFRAALENRPLPIHGDGSQTRSLCYVDDEVEGILRLLLSDEVEPVNIGNPEEVTILELADTIQDVVGNHPGVEFQPRPTDDPTVRRPDTTRAEERLGWKAQVSLREGLERTLPWFKEVLGY